MTEQLLYFRFRFREFILPNDQFPPEAGRFDRGESLEDIERHTGHSD